jgi:hypothetical protein
MVSRLASFGESPQVGEYQRRFPEQAQAVHQAFQATSSLARSQREPDRHDSAEEGRRPDEVMPLEKFCENLVQSELLTRAELSTFQETLRHPRTSTTRWVSELLWRCQGAEQVGVSGCSPLRRQVSIRSHSGKRRSARVMRRRRFS